MSLKPTEIIDYSPVDLLYQLTSVARYQLRNIKNADPLEKMFSKFYKGTDNYIYFREQFDRLWDEDLQSDERPNIKNLYQKFKEVAIEKDLQNHIDFLAKSLHYQLFWKGGMAQVAEYGKKLIPPRLENQNPNWREKPNTDDEILFGYIINNEESFFEIVEMVLRAELKYRSDGTAGRSRTRDEVFSGKNPFYLSQVINEFLEVIDNEVRREVNQDGKVDENNLGLYFQWFEVDKFSLLKGYRIQSLEELLKELAKFGIKWQKCHNRPISDDPILCDEPNQRHWIQLPKFIKQFVINADKATNTKALAILLHGFLRSIESADFDTVWLSYILMLFGIVLVLSYLDEGSQSDPHITEAISIFNTSSDEFMHIVYYTGLLLVLPFGTRPAQEFCSAFSNMTKIRPFIAYNASGVIISNTTFIKRTPHIKNTPIKTVFNLVNTIFRQYEINIDINQPQEQE